MSIDECRIKEFYRLKIVVRRGNELRVSGFKVQRLDRLESGEPGTENPDKVSVFSPPWRDGSALIREFLLRRMNAVSE